MEPRVDVTAAATGPSASRRVVVTGVAGMVGSHVAERLLARGDAVVGVDNLLTGDPANLVTLRTRPGFTFVAADVSEGVPVDGPVDAVLHLASPASPRHFRTIPLEILRVGGIGILNALESARAHGARFLFASSSEVYGDPAVHPQREDYTGNVFLHGERACYDESKRFGEAATDTYRRACGLDTRIVRIFNTYGPRLRFDDGRVVSNFVTQALRGEPLTVYGEGDQTRSYCYVEDLARGIVALLDSDVTIPVNLGNPAEVTVLELATTVLDLVGSGAGIRHEPLPQHDPARRRPDITRATELLGWAPEVTLSDGLRRTIDHVAAHLPAPV
jgi:dTDP-glucose 4,6-dehydratase